MRSHAAAVLIFLIGGNSAHASDGELAARQLAMVAAHLDLCPALKLGPGAPDYLARHGLTMTDISDGGRYFAVMAEQIATVKAMKKMAGTDAATRVCPAALEMYGPLGWAARSLVTAR